MKFAIPDSDSDEEYSVVVDIDNDAGFYSDDSDDFRKVPNLTRQPRTKLGAAIRDYLASSESEDEPDSEDEVGDLLDMRSVVSKTSWREPKIEKGKSKALPPAPRTRSTSSQPKAGPSWQRWEPSVRDLLRDDGPSEYTQWMKTTESEAWRHGHRIAGERQAELERIKRNVHHELARAQQSHRDREADELQRMMEGLAVRAKAEEENRSKRFHEREAKLWADIDAAIKDAERRHGDEQAARAAAERKRKDDEAARIAAAEKEALARKAEAERLAKEQAEKDAADKAERERRVAEETAAQAAAEKAEADKKAAADTSQHGANEWRKWVEIQQRMKAEVIEPVKADRGIRTAVKPSMRLINRWLGQVTNTRQTILRVTDDICQQLNSQLPQAPSAANPVVFGEPGQLHPPYYYLISHTAKALVKQAEGEVDGNPEAAFPLARIILGIMLRGHAAFGTVVFARLVKKCPWVVPYWPQRAEGQPRDEYEKSTGMGVDESRSDYIRRMTGIVRMYFAVLALPLSSLVPTLPSKPTPQQLPILIPEPWRLPTAWSWVATALRPPLPAHQATAPFLLIHIETLGHALASQYGPKQVGKLLAAIKAGVQSGAIRGDTDATRANIIRAVDQWEQTQSLPAPRGLQWT